MSSATSRRGTSGRRRGPIVLAGLALLAIAAWFYRDHVREEVFPKNFGVVDQGRLYRSGGLTPAATRRVHDRYGVRTIVDLGAWEPGSDDDRRAQRTAEALGVTRLRFDLAGDGTGDPNQYVEALRVMTDPARQPVLVHCGAGSERTGIAVILYRRFTAGTPIEQGYEEAQRFKHRPSRNPRFREVLDRYAGAILAALRDGTRVIEPEPPARAMPDAAPPR